MYQALYRKWRPQTFDEVVGQKHITETLKNQVKTGRLSHAYIFIGTRGTGKTTCARILARAVNCENPVDGNPCGVCPACRGISEGTVMDVVELDAASNNGVDNVRALREEAVFSPAAVKKRVYIIDEVHMLSTPAFNALLKILEEPPAHLMFILATTELQKVPATILSRCQRHSFRRIATPEIAEYLEYIAGREGFKLSHEAAELIGRLAEGGVRDALSLLDQCSAAENIDLEAVYSAMGLAGNRRTAELLGHIIDHDPAAALKEFSAMWMDGKDPATLLNELNALMRDTLMLQVAPRGAAALISGGYDGAVLSGFAKQMTTEELICAMDTVQRALNGLRDVKNPKTAVELCLISLCDNVLGESLNRLRARVSRLEEQMKNGLPARPVQSPETEDDGTLPFYRGRAPEEPEYVPPEEPEYVPPEERFEEEQPEDAFLARRLQRSAPAPAPAADDGLLWKKVCAAVETQLPMDLRVSLGDEKRVCGRTDGTTLYVEVLPGFLFGRFNRQEILSKFAEAARAAAGRDMRVQLLERKETPRQKRSLEELKKFKEVRFI